MRRLTPRQQALVQLLADGEFHSGEQIGERLGISRAAVSQQLKGLRTLGLEVFSVSGRGHALAHPLDIDAVVCRHHINAVDGLGVFDPGVHQQDVAILKGGAHAVAVGMDEAQGGLAGWLQAPGYPLL